VTLPGTAIPADSRAYLDVGRFRNGLILDKLKHRSVRGPIDFAGRRMVLPPRSTK